MDGAHRFSSRFSFCFLNEQSFQVFFVVFHTLLQSSAVRPSFCISRRVYVFLLSELIIYEKNKKIKTLSHCCRRRRRGRRHRHNRHMHVKYRNETKLYVRTHETRCLTRNCVLLLDCVVCVYIIYILVRKKRRRKEMTIYKKSNSVSFRVL